MSQLFVFHKSLQCLMIDKDLNEKFRVNELRTLMFEATNDN